MKMDFKISKITLAGLIIAIVGVFLQLVDGITYSINGIQIFPFVIIPVGILISLLGFMIKQRE